MKAIKCVFLPNDLLTAECIIAIYQSYKKRVHITWEAPLI